MHEDQKIESALVESSVGTDSLLVPSDYWNRLNPQERKDLRKKLPILLRKYSKRIAAMERLHHKAGKIKYNRGVVKMKKFSIRVNTGVWANLSVLAAAHGVSRCYLFNYMLWLEDLSGEEDFFVKRLNQGVPSFHWTYKMIWKINRKQNLISRELQFEPNPMTNQYPYYLNKS
ncbi:PF07600 family protein [Leptospira noguchii serovar Panama str. CZ214]|uniref:PF07600 family protein n=1 Tax=Leptospira noguchii serovar Panama str. CZ214 TaxID=1001595 RepID=T0GU39_9LEPT|nr:PF07600 family protein [Leptospira noguchii serovar Panama str. CZ214]